METILRRNQLDKMTDAEKKIFEAIQAVETMGADEGLTFAVIHLQKARECVADFVDGIPFTQPLPIPTTYPATSTKPTNTLNVANCHKCNQDMKGGMMVVNLLYCCNTCHNEWYYIKSIDGTEYAMVQSAT